MWCLQVALNAVQRRLNSLDSSASNKAAEIRSLEGALHQSSVQYKQLLEQHKLMHSQASAQTSSAAEVTKLQTAHKQVCHNLDQSKAQLQQKKQQVQLLQDQLQQNVKDSRQTQQLVEQLSKAVADMHSVIDQAGAASEVDSASGFVARHNLQAVHDAVQDKLSRYESRSPAPEFSPDELLLPVLWKPQKERHIATAGYR